MYYSRLSPKLISSVDSVDSVDSFIFCVVKDIFFQKNIGKLNNPKIAKFHHLLRMKILKN
ncbi:MAG: hypothetical protein ACI9LN_000951 [Saprospiraceae bacterium]|jgi:hypothetical protein